MNQHALVVLQFPEALELVARFAATPLGAGAVRAAEPSDAPAWVETELRRVDQMVGFLLRSEGGWRRRSPTCASRCVAWRCRARSGTARRCEMRGS